MVYISISGARYVPGVTGVKSISTTTGAGGADLYAKLINTVNDLWQENYVRVRFGGRDRYDKLSREELARILAQMEAGTFRFSPMRRIRIPKLNKPGQTRPITMPFKKHVIVMDGLHIVLRELYEKVFMDCSHGFRPRRGVQTFCAQVTSWRDVKWLIQADLRGCFDCIPQERLLLFIRRRVEDARLMQLLTAFCECRIWDIENKKYLDLHGVGVPQGSPVSPLLMNCYCHQIDWAIAKRFPGFHYVRYADDLLLASSVPGVCVKEIQRELGILLGGFGFQVVTKALLPGGLPAKVLGIHLAIGSGGHPDFRVMGNLVRKRIMIAHNCRSLPAKDWRTKVQGYLALYACSRESDFRSFEHFLQTKSSRLLDEFEQDDRRFKERLTWARSLNALRKFRARFLALVAREQKKRGIGGLQRLKQDQPP